MTRNEGTADRLIRGALGLILLALALFGSLSSTAVYWGALIVGLVLVVTALTGFCGIYRLLGVNTCGSKR